VKPSRFPFFSSSKEWFREYDEFYLPYSSTDIMLFNSSLAAATVKGFEVFTLDNKQPWSVPDLKAPHVATIAARLQNQAAVAMLRLSDSEFLCCFTECAVYVNRNGDISRSVIMEYIGNAQRACLRDDILLLFDKEFVEIRNAQNGRLRQIISGDDIKLIDDGRRMSGERPLKMVMIDPLDRSRQLLLELVLRDEAEEQGESV
jgi:hypothetical protein